MTVNKAAKMSMAVNKMAQQAGEQQRLVKVDESHDSVDEAWQELIIGGIWL